MSRTQEMKRSQHDLSLQTKKDELKKIGDNIEIMKNRVGTLKHQLQKQKDHIKINKQLVRSTIQKKIQVNKINRYRSRDPIKQQKHIQILKQRNKTVRINHQNQLTNVQKAIYLVKCDDARYTKNVSLQYQKKINIMQKDFLQQQKQRRDKVCQEQIKGKQKYNLYWKDKLEALDHQKTQSMAQVQEKTAQKKQQLKQLEIQQLQLMDQISKYHTQHVQSKKQYLSTLKLPAKTIKQQQPNQPKSTKVRKNQGRSHHSRFSQNTPRRQLDEPDIKIPNAYVNQTKLKLVLKQLKQSNDRQTPIYSQRQKR